MFSLTSTLLILTAVGASCLFWWKFRSPWGFVAAAALALVVAAAGPTPDEERIARDLERQAASERTAADPFAEPDRPPSREPDRPAAREMAVTTVAGSVQELQSQRPIEVTTHGYVGSDACRECHLENHATWEGSYHRTMTQLAKPEIVLGDFDDVHVRYKDRDYYLRRRGETLVVDIPDEENPDQRLVAPVVMTTGSHHMQVYWFATGAERKLGMLPLVHLNESQEWIPRESAFLVLPHESPSFEMGRWNETCSVCHSTHRKGRRLDSGEWDTHVGEFGISCEACHGPGEDHLRYHRAAGTESLSAGPPPTSDPIVNPQNLTKVRSAQVCGQCHAVLDPLHMDAEYQENGHGYRPGMDLTKTHGVWNRDTPEYESTRKTLNYPDLDTLLNETYYPDGMIRVSGREYNGLIESSCYVNGEMTCLSCHQMHQSTTDERTLADWADDQLRPEALGDGACLQCHQAEQFSTPAHTHHPIGSSGATCYNCHMPHTAYGLLKAIRNHQISIPDVARDDGAQRPNACNLCHLDQTLQWSAGHLQDWYGIEPPEFDDDQRQVAASIVWLLRGNAAERALSAWAMGWDEAQAVSGTDWQLPFLISLLDDDYDAIRLIARRSLQSLPGTKDFQMDLVTSSTGEDRQRAALQEFDRWMEQTASTRVDRPELLIKKANGFDIRRVNQLLEQRDNTPMLLSE